MRAIRFEAFGDPSVLELVEVAPPATDEKRALVRIMAASINPSDAKNVADSLALGGSLIEIASTGQREVCFDVIDFRDVTASAKVLDALTPGFAAGDYRASPIVEICGLGEAQEAYRKVAATAAGRIVLRPQE